MIKKKQAKKRVIKKKQIKKLRLRASSANQWARCTGLLDLEKNQNPLNDSSAAEFGNVVHKLSEILLKAELSVWVDCNYLQTKEFVQIMFGTLTALEMTIFATREEDVYNYINFYYTHIQQDVLYLRDAYNLNIRDITFYVEHRTEIKTDNYDMSPIIDFALSFEYMGELYVYVYDLKTGFGEIEAKGNLQLAIYGNALAKEIGFTGFPNIIGKIIQPPIYSKKTTNILYNKNFFNNLYTEPSKRKFQTGSQCTYCSHHDVCPTLKKKMKKYLNPTFLDTTIARVYVWPELLTMAKPLTSMFKQVKSAAKEYMLTGALTLKDWEVATKNGDRQWIQEANISHVSKKLKLKKADIEVKKMLSAPKVGNLLKEAGKDLSVYEDLIYQPTLRYIKKVKGVKGK